uniref:WGS project CAEQ00000000 data, annotated contig 2255 n=1 Tax=Trypanosoma congolense (strain IL3000) TaxID=1068625 RepID=F9WCP3_TRYCI|nr:unnamed protein product [Trypanosoma congolense IL3000]
MSTIDMHNPTCTTLLYVELYAAEQATRRKIHRETFSFFFFFFKNKNTMTVLRTLTRQRLMTEILVLIQMRNEYTCTVTVHNTLTPQMYIYIYILLTALRTSVFLPFLSDLVQFFFFLEDPLESACHLKDSNMCEKENEGKREHYPFFSLFFLAS